MLTIPIDNTIKNQTFQVKLTGKTYTFSLRYNTQADAWSFGIGDSRGAMIYQGIFLKLGLNYCKIRKDRRLPSGALLIVNTNKEKAEPNGDNLGVDCQMVYDETFNFE